MDDDCVRWPRSIVATAVVRLDDLVVLWHGRVLAAADHVESVGFAVVDERFLYRFSGGSGFVVQRAAWHDFRTGRGRQIEVDQLVVLQHLLLVVVLWWLRGRHFVDALVPAAAGQGVLDGRQVPMVHFSRFSVGHEAYGYGVHALVGRLFLVLVLLVLRVLIHALCRRTVIVKVRMRWQLDDKHLRIRTALTVRATGRCILAPRLTGQPFPVMVPPGTGTHSFHAQLVQQFGVVLFERRVFRRFGRRGFRYDRRHRRVLVLVIGRGNFWPIIGAATAPADVVAVFVGRRYADVLIVFLRVCRRNDEKYHHGRGHHRP